MTLFLPPLAGGERRRASLDVARESQRGAPHLVERPPLRDADVDVHAARSGRLRPPHQAELAQRSVHNACHLAHL